MAAVTPALGPLRECGHRTCPSSRFAPVAQALACRLLFLALLAPLRAAAAAEDALLKVALDGNANAVARSRAFADLGAVASEKSLPALASLLGDPCWRDAARSVIEAMPGPAADRALLQALDSARDATASIGLVNSLGARRCTEAAAPVAKLLTATEEPLVLAALGALGDIGTPRAVEALLAFDPPPPVAAAWGDAIIRGADALQRRDRSTAFKAYQLAVSKAADAQVAAATIGLAHIAEDPAAVIGDSLASKRRPRQLAALALIRSGEFGSGVTEAVERLFATLPPDVQVPVLSVLQDRGDRAAARTARAALRSERPEVRAAAARLLAVVGEADDTAALLPLMNGDGDVAVAARLALARLPGEAPAQQLRDAFRGTGPSRDAALEVLLARGDRTMVADLLRPDIYRDEDFGQRALTALGALAAGSELGAALALYAQLPATLRTAGETALRRIATREPVPDRATATVNAAIKQMPSTETATLHLLLAAIGGDAAFETLTAAAKSGSAEQRKTALRALGQWRDPRPAEALLAIARNEGDPGVRAIAVRSATNLYSKSAFGGGNAARPALIPDAIAGLRKVWPLATQRPERNAILVALRGFKDARAQAAADELESAQP